MEDCVADSGARESQQPANNQENPGKCIGCKSDMTTDAKICHKCLDRALKDGTFLGRLMTDLGIGT